MSKPPNVINKCDICPYLVRKHVRRLIHGLLVRRIRNPTKAFESVVVISAAGPVDHEVVVLLTVSYVADWDGTTGLHDRAVEQALIISTVRYHLHGHRDGTRTFSPAARN